MMPGVEMEEVCRALAQAYDLDSLTQMLLFRLDRNLPTIVATNAPLNTVIFRLVLLADQEGWDDQLIKEARRYNPGNRNLISVYEKYGYAPKIAVQSQNDPDSKQELNASSPGLEAILRQGNPALDINRILSR